MADTQAIRDMAIRISGDEHNWKLIPEARQDARLRADLHLCTAEVCERLDRVIELLEDDPERSP